MQLRWYQLAALEAVYSHLREKETNPCVVLPTGSGKSPLIAQIASDAVNHWSGRVLVLAHRKELLEQNAEKLHFFAPDLKYGIYSAGLKRRDTRGPVVFAGIQSVYKRGEDLGHFDLVIVDEAHLIPPEGDGMYQTYLQIARAINPSIRVIGMTATPFRMKSGALCHKDGILNEVVYEAPVGALVAQGFLTNLVAKNGHEKNIIETQGVRVTGGEFNSAELVRRAMSGEKAQFATKEFYELTKDRNKVLVFCAGVLHAQYIEQVLQKWTYSVQSIFGDTPSDLRAERLEKMRSGTMKYTLNVGVFTEGLDVPDIDAIVLMRPTKSTGLYAQMVGRGFRIAEGKKNCLILDYGRNVERHGPIDEIRISKVLGGERPGTMECEKALAKECPECEHLIALGYGKCPHCGHEFPPPDPDLDETASALDIMGRKPRVEWCKVGGVQYEKWKKSGWKPGDPHTLRVDYNISFYKSVSEWICFEHDIGSYARGKAMRWWKKRVKPEHHNLPLPSNVDEALQHIERLGIKEPGKILVKFAVARDKFDRIEDYEFSLNTGELLSDINAALEEPEEEVDLPF